MNFIFYLILGSVAYTAGFMINQKQLLAKRKKGEVYGLMHPVILKWLALCFVIMLGVSMLIGKFMLKHQSIDIAYVIINSLVATVVFYFGLNPDENNLKPPE